MYPDQFKFQWPALKSMVGTDDYHMRLLTGASLDQLQDFFDVGPANFEKSASPTCSTDQGRDKETAGAPGPRSAMRR